MNASEFMPVPPRFDELEAARAHKYVPAAHPSTKRFMEIMEELAALHIQKGKDYGSEADPFANVSSSEDFGIPSWKAAMVRANDKMKRIQRYACTGTLANEGVIDSFNDLAVYAVIGRVLFERGMK
jgi:hypothetical protein